MERNAPTSTPSEGFPRPWYVCPTTPSLSSGCSLLILQAAAIFNAQSLRLGRGLGRHVVVWSILKTWKHPWVLDPNFPCLSHLRLWHGPFMGSKQESVGTRTVHFITLPWMDSFFLHSLNFQGIQLLIQNLIEIHDNTFMNILPQVSTEYLKQWYFMGYLQNFRAT